MPRITAHIPDALMLIGLATALSGLYLLFGLGWTLLIGGALVAAYGVAADLRWP